MEEMAAATWGWKELADLCLLLPFPLSAVPARPPALARHGSAYGMRKVRGSEAGVVQDTGNPKAPQGIPLLLPALLGPAEPSPLVCFGLS